MARIVVIVGLAAIALSSRAYGQAFRLGSEFTASTQPSPVDPSADVAAAPSGEFVAVWAGETPGGSSAILARRFDSAGTAIGSDLQVGTATAGSLGEPAVAADAAGDFVVVWSATDGSSSGAVGRRFSSSGTGIGTEFRVESYVLGYGPREPDVASDADGNLFVVWTDLGIQGRRFDGGGAPPGAQFPITSAEEAHPAVAADADGDFVVVWVAGSEAIEGRRFGADGAPLGLSFQVESAPYVEDAPAIELDAPAVAADATGNFVVAWERYQEAASDFGPARSDVFVRGFDSAGNPRGGDFQITGAPHYYYNPSIAPLAAGEFLVAWDGYQYGGSAFNVYAQRVSADGGSIGGKFRINSTLSGYQTAPSVASAAASDFVVIWSDYSPLAPDRDVRGQRFTTKATTPICNEGALAGRALVKLGKLAPPAGDENLLMKGTILFPPGVPPVFDPTNAGAQILIEDLGAGDAALYDLSHLAQAVPGGGGCGPDDGWKGSASGSSHTYRNKSGALPPACAPGSANGLALIKLKDKRESTGEIVFKLKAKRAAIGAPAGPLRVTLVFGAGAAESDAGECGVAPFAPDQCAASGSAFKCDSKR